MLNLTMQIYRSNIGSSSAYHSENPKSRICNPCRPLSEVSAFYDKKQLKTPANARHRNLNQDCP